MTRPDGETREYDIVIIGSGAGGGTVAQELAPMVAQGVRILVLEQGARLEEHEFTGRELEMSSALYEEAGLVLGHQDVRGVAGEALAHAAQRGKGRRPQEQGARPDASASRNHHPGRDAIVAGRPRRRQPLFAGASLVYACDDGVVLDAQRLGPRHHLDAAALGGRQLHAVRPHLGRVGTPHVA